MKTFISDISGKEFPISARISGKTIRSSILNLIQKEHPLFTDECYLSVPELNHFREKHIAEYLAQQLGELTDLKKNVLTSLKDKTTLTDKISDEEVVPLTTGQRIADKVASFGGSWTFIIIFGLFLLAWISLNIVWLANKGFDPYPFILLNLILSCIAAIQAPVIMMSQNRQEEKDRARAKNDYMINLKSELEIRMLHEKIDHLTTHQQQELQEIQNTQLKVMNELLEKMGKMTDK
jgi:uncharacterized membrane protein